MTKKRIFTWLAALVLFVSAMISFVALPKKNVASAAEAQVPKDLYYFRVTNLSLDEEEAEADTLCASLKRMGVINSYVVKAVSTTDNNIIDLIAYGELFDGLIDLDHLENYPNGGALIYDTDGTELSSGVNAMITYYLEETFETLHNHGFRIMFICGTDEYNFYAHKTFLGYVDIHINKDIYTTFYTNVLYAIYLFYGSSFEWSKLTILLSESLYKSEFISKILMPMFSQGLPDSETGPRDYCAMNNVKILVYYNDTMFIDGLTGEILQNVNIYSNEISEYFERQKVVAIGANWGSAYDVELNAADDHWLNMISEAMGVYEGRYEDMTLYQYEHYPKTLYLPVYLANGPYDITYIIEDFLSCEDPQQDLMQYDNWTGLCEITHKTLKSGPNGWMYDIYCGDGEGLSFLGALFEEMRS